MNGKVVIIAGIAVVALLLIARSWAGDGGKRASTLGGNANEHGLSTAEFAAGCFWHVEDTFRTVEGVVSTEVGYEGGTLAHPSYRDVCTDRTGHAETVRVHYDPSKVTYEKLLEAFFNLHDPTTVDRQGPDVGTQYRSIVFYGSPEEKSKAEAFKTQLAKSGRYSRPVVTGVVPASTFWKAEDYHQQYFEKQRGDAR